MPTISCYAGKREFREFLDNNPQLSLEEAEKYLTSIGNEHIRLAMTTKLTPTKNGEKK